MVASAKSTGEVLGGYYADCYVLVHRRDWNFVNDFLDRFVPVRSESANEYEVPQYSTEPRALFKSAHDLFDCLAERPNEEHAIYWRNEQPGEIHGAMCFPTNDGQMVVGLYCDTRYPDTSIEKEVLQWMMDYCSSDIGYFTYEEPPPTNSKEFAERSKQQNGI